MKVSALTLLPEASTRLGDYSMIGHATEKGVLGLDTVRIRNFADNKRKKVDGYSFGDRPKTVVSLQPLFDAITNLLNRPGIYYLPPQGRVLDQEKLFSIREEENIVPLNGHYEGIDQRVISESVDGEISIGDHILNGRGMASLVTINGTSRPLDGVLGPEESYMDESHTGGFLKFPQYTRPADSRGLEVPDVPLSGHHEKIEDYRLYQRMKKTLLKRPDVFEKISLNEREEKIYRQIKSDLREGGQSN